ncbi:MAG: hypothetical protein H6597_08105 [Flavobacteriales bacterium]|nr:hypothetical protein [Flavobacteriales bacterium]MCB9194477.1 hypothetical protein [Flavobacteriales bacterium]
MSSGTAKHALTDRSALRILSLPCSVLLVSAGAAQPDTLFVPSGDTTYAYAVSYAPHPDTEVYTLKGYYAFDTMRTAVELDFKRGRPSGVYRAYYPDGKPLIFAVYGWGSLNGDWTEYDEFGKVSLKGRYHNGQRDGLWAFRKEGILARYKKGVANGKWRYYKNGHLVRIVKYRDGKPVPGSDFRLGNGASP